VRETASVAHRKTLAALVFGLVSAFLLAAPPDARAQFPPESWGSADYCASVGPKGRTAPDPFSTLTVGISAGSGVITPRMWGTPADCITPQGSSCPPACSFQVQTVCEFHCGHDHTPPFPWTVGLSGSGTGGSSFLDWNGSCVGVKEAPRTMCIVRMNSDQTVTATFGPADAAPPTPPGLNATAGSYSAALTWSPSSDAYLLGYEIYRDGALLARVPDNVTSFQVENLFCSSSYSFQVKAYDSVHEAASAVVPLRTGSCGATAAPRPNTVIHIKPPRSTRARTAFFHYGTRGTLRATRYQCKLDRGRWRKCSGRLGKRYRGLKPGWHAFRVRAGNANGFDRTPAKHTWRVRR
jgi:hypothetical protein